MFAVRHYPRLVTPALLTWLRSFVRYDEDGRCSCWLATCGGKGESLPRLLSDVADVVAPGVHWSGALLQCYRDGSAATPCHSDPGGGFILSLGAPRTFRTHRGSCDDALDVMTIECVEGTVLVMDEEFHRDWHHQIVPDQHVTEEKLSLVFRSRPAE